MRVLFSLALVVCGVAAAQVTPVPPPPTGTPSHPFFITKTWIVGGVGDWDYLTMDPTARQLLIAHGPTVQVVDVENRGARRSGQGHARNSFRRLGCAGIFWVYQRWPRRSRTGLHRRTFQIVANIPTGPSPRSMALDQTSGSALCRWLSNHPASTQSTRTPQGTSRRMTPGGGDSSRTSPQGGPISTVTVIDTERRVPLAQITLSGSLGFAQGEDG